MRLHRVITIAVASAAAFATGVAGLAGPATARPATRGYTAQDARHDVVRLDTKHGNGPGTVVAHRKAGDLLSMHAAYADGSVAVTLQYAELPKPQGRHEQALTIVGLRTDQGTTADAYLVASGAGPRRHLEWLSGHSTRCRGLAGEVDRVEARVHFTVPGSCLADPAWVRVGGGAATVVGRRVWADDVQRSGAVGDEVALGPRLHQE